MHSHFVWIWFFICFISLTLQNELLYDSTTHIGIVYDLSADITFDDANTYCQTEYGTYLATIWNETIQESLNNAASGDNSINETIYNCWIGLWMRSSEERWIQSTSIAPFAYNNWAPGEPTDSGDNHCAYFGSNGTWAIADCQAATSPESLPCFACYRYPPVPTLQPTFIPTQIPTNESNITPTTIPTPNPTYEYTRIRVFERNTSISWRESRIYCNETFGTDLASIHDVIDDSLAQNLVAQYGDAVVSKKKFDSK